jgi:hypothetical protein
MSAAAPAPDTPVVSVAEVIARMEAIEASLPAADGFACFNRMYLDVTRQLDSRISQGFFADTAFMTQLEVEFANMFLFLDTLAASTALAGRMLLVAV